MSYELLSLAHRPLPLSLSWFGKLTSRRVHHDTPLVIPSLSGNIMTIRIPSRYFDWLSMTLPAGEHHPLKRALSLFFTACLKVYIIKFRLNIPVQTMASRTRMEHSALDGIVRPPMEGFARR